jgi:hypothetical protein
VTGCQGVKTAKKGRLVSCPDAPPTAGDTVLVAPGVYAETLAEEPTGSYPYPLAVVAITVGGTKGEPVVFKGLPGTIIDGRDEIIGVALAASHVVFEGFEVRKGGVWANRADKVVLRSCAVHGGNKGVSFHYVSNAQISGNIVYDIVGAWRAAPRPLSRRRPQARREPDLQSHVRVGPARLERLVMDAHVLEPDGLSLSHPIARVDFGEGEILQCQYLARMYATALGEGCIAYSYHTLANLTWDVLDNPLLGLKALHTMREMLGDAAPLGRTEVGRYHVCYLFETRTSASRLAGPLPLKSRVVAALWAKDAEYAAPVPMTLPGGIDCFDMLGFPLSTRTGGATSFPLGRELLYLVFDGANADQVRKMLASKFAHGGQQRNRLSGLGGTSLSAAKGVVEGRTTPFAALRDVPPNASIPPGYCFTGH